MSILDVILIGVALAMDAFALTIANCTAYKNSLTKKKLWSMPAAFAIFQFLMPVAGFYLGSLLWQGASEFAGYITFAIFLLLSLKIVIDNVKELKENERPDKTEEIKNESFNLKVLILQAIATSIDAFLIGASEFAINLSSPFISSIIVGGITFFIVSAALFIGKGLGKALGKFAQWFGAAILFALAIKELIQAII